MVCQHPGPGTGVKQGTAGLVGAVWSLQVVGSILGPPLADLVGRRVCCLLAAMASAASWLLLSSATSGNEATWPPGHLALPGS